jgi:hypothetical protein
MHCSHKLRATQHVKGKLFSCGSSFIRLIIAKSGLGFITCIDNLNNEQINEPILRSHRSKLSIYKLSEFRVANCTACNIITTINENKLIED